MRYLKPSRSQAVKDKVNSTFENFGGANDKTLNERTGYALMSLASRVKAKHHAMTAEELAEVLNVSRLTILRRAKRGTIPSFRVGSCVRFAPEAKPAPGHCRIAVHDQQTKLKDA
jgi:excisionase family DNA binding protein